tara:strand:+ start:7751 stop:8314 length:564 start_codon:yes stop_codon:yes gene_type:complete
MAKPNLTVKMIGMDSLMKMFNELSNQSQVKKDLMIYMRKGLPLIQKAQIGGVQQHPTSGTGFVVRRDGADYATTTKQQLVDSIRIFRTRANRSGSTWGPDNWAGFYVGPRVKGKYKFANTGGWFAHWYEYGVDRAGRGKNIKIKAKPFANTPRVKLALRQWYDGFVRPTRKKIEQAFKRHQRNLKAA